tara:strand:+ start:1081 stop:1506 length:426 start_codon:yes stop_codon:yes gene_type:complete
LISGWNGKTTSNYSDTIQLGKEFSNYLQPNDVIGFIGDLGSGKTTFIKGILEGMKYNQRVTSPTFTLINEYPAKIPVVHIDCYRKDNLKEWFNIGIDDYFFSGKIVLVEWAEKIKLLLPDNTIFIKLDHQSKDKRKINILE